MQIKGFKEVAFDDLIKRINSFIKGKQDVTIQYHKDKYWTAIVTYDDGLWCQQVAGWLTNQEDRINQSVYQGIFTPDEARKRIEQVEKQADQMEKSGEGLNVSQA